MLQLEKLPWRRNIQTNDWISYTAHAIQPIRCLPSNVCRARRVARRDTWQPYVQPTCTFPLAWHGTAWHGLPMEISGCARRDLPGLQPSNGIYLLMPCVRLRDTAMLAKQGTWNPESIVHGNQPHKPLTCCSSRPRQCRQPFHIQPRHPH
jgi:hypothetical protein